MPRKSDVRKMRKHKQEESQWEEDGKKDIDSINDGSDYDNSF